MSIANDNWAPEAYQFALAEQSGWGTAVTADASFQKLYLTNKPMPDWSGAVRVETKRANGSLIADVEDVYVSETRTWPTFVIEGRATTETLHLLIYGANQSTPTEGAPTAYKRTYTLDETLRGINNNIPKKFFTCAFYDPASGVKQRLKNCVIRDLELSADPGSDGGLVLFKANLQSFGAADRNATLVPGSWLPHGTTFLPWNAIQVKQLNSADLVLGMWKLAISNGCVPLPTVDSSGNAEGVRFPAFEITSEARARWDANTTGTLAKWLTNPAGGSADAPFELRYYGATDDDMFGFVLNAVHVADPKHDFGQASGTMVNLSMKAMSDLTNGTDPLVITEANATQMQWT